MAKPKVLYILSSHDKLGDTGKPTGWFLPELAHPYLELSGHTDTVVASPKGGTAPLDPASVEMFKSDPSSQEFKQKHEDLWTNTSKLSDYVGKANEFAAIFYVGGHGPMFDLANDSSSQTLVREFFEAGKVVAAVCHGPVALLNAQLSDGAYIVDGQPITALSNEEEVQHGTAPAMPFELQTALEERGCKWEMAKPNEAHVAVGRGGRLLTGQNPASAAPLAKAVLKAIS